MHCGVWGGDWPVVSAIRCLKGPKHGCMDCECKAGEFSKIEGVSLTTFPWKFHTHATYLADIASHTVPVVVSEPAC